MKRLSGLVLLFVFFTSYAQLPDNQFLYVNGGYSGGNLTGGQVGVNFAVDDKFSIHVEYSGVTRKSKSTPVDYTGGFFGALALGTTAPKDNIHSFRIMAGTVKTINSTGKVRINLKAGFSVLTIKEPYNWEKIWGLLLVPNYTWDYRSKQQLGLVLKPEFEFVFANFIGAAITPYCELTREISTVGIGFNLLLGKVRLKQ